MRYRNPLYIILVILLILVLLRMLGIAAEWDIPLSQERLIGTFAARTISPLADSVWTFNSGKFPSKKLLSDFLLKANNLSGLANTNTALVNLGGTTIGINLFTLPNTSAEKFIRIEASGSVSQLTASAFLSAIGGIDGSSLNADNISSGTVAADRLGSSGGVGKFLGYDNVWHTITSGTGDALTTDPLSQFASTTSAELAGVLSDEHGFSSTEKALFANGTIVIPTGDTLTVPSGGGTLGTGAFRSYTKLLFSSFATVSSTHTSALNEDDLFSYTVPANTLNANGDCLQQVEHVKLAAHATALRQIQKYLGGQRFFDSTPVATTSATDLTILTTIVRESPTEVRMTVCVVTATGTSSSVPRTVYTRPSVNFSTNLILKTTSVISGTGGASGDASETVGTVFYIPAP